MKTEDLIKQVADISELVKKNQVDMTENITAEITKALASHPGFTKRREIEFGDTKTIPTQAEEILQEMPAEARQAMDDCVLISKILRIPVNRTKTWNKFGKIAGDYKKALDASTAGEGLEWVPTDFSSELIAKVHLGLKVAALFPVINMPTNPYTLPIEIGDIDSFILAEQTGDSPTKVASGEPAGGWTSSTTFTAKWLGTKVLTSKILEEDSIIAILPLLRQRMTLALVRGEEDIVINGDTTGTHMDSDTTAANSKRKAFMGLRANAKINSYTTDLSSFNVTNLRAMRAAMGVYGVDPSQLAIIVGVKGYMKMLGLSEVLTLDKIGANATILKGQMAQFDGSPVIVSEQVRENLNANGVFDNVTTSKTVLHYVYTGGYAIGRRRETIVQLLQEIYAESAQDALLVSERVAVNSLFPIATNRLTQMGINFQ